jgi:hypothetical protein
MCSINETSAQTSRELEQNVMINVLPSSVFGIGADYAVGCNIDDVFFVGGGIGIGTWLDDKDEYWTDTWFPIFLQIKSSFLRNRYVRPYISLSTGLDFCTCGIVLNPNVGISIKTTDSTRLHIGVGYSAYSIEYELDEAKIKWGLSAHIGLSF